jgi:hypothetical protein
VRYGFQLPAWREFWKQRKFIFAPEFVARIDEVGIIDSTTTYRPFAISEEQLAKH